MYMYYLLGHRLIDNDEFDENRVKVRSKNTYLMALDGDIDFQPDAVHLLVQYMKKKNNLGAACGRIHPVGELIILILSQNIDVISISRRGRNVLVPSIRIRSRSLDAKSYRTRHWLCAVFSRLFLFI